LTNKPSRKKVLARSKIRYTTKELRDTIEVLLAYTLDELFDLYNCSGATIYERILAACLIQALKEKRLPTIETLLSRVCGKPRETIDITPSNEKIMKPFTAVDSVDAARAYADLVRR